MEIPSKNISVILPKNQNSLCINCWISHQVMPHMLYEMYQAMHIKLTSYGTFFWKEFQNNQLDAWYWITDLQINSSMLYCIKIKIFCTNEFPSSPSHFLIKNLLLNNLSKAGFYRQYFVSLDFENKHYIQNFLTCWEISINLKFYLNKIPKQNKI